MTWLRGWWRRRLGLCDASTVVDGQRVWCKWTAGHEMPHLGKWSQRHGTWFYRRWE